MFEMKRRKSFINFSQFSTYVKIKVVRRTENNRLDHNQFRLCKEVVVSHEKRKQNKTKETLLPQQTTSVKSDQLKNASSFGRLRPCFHDRFFKGRLAKGNRKSRENISFSNSFKVKRVGRLQ